HTLQRSVRSEQRRGRPKELLHEGLRRKWLGASLLLSHRSLRICSFVAPRPKPFWAQRNTSYMRDTTLEPRRQPAGWAKSLTNACSPPGRGQGWVASKARGLPVKTRTRTSQGNARMARTIQSTNSQHPECNAQQPATNNIQDRTSKRVASRSAVGQPRPTDGNGAAGEGSQPPNAEQNS